MYIYGFNDKNPKIMSQNDLLKKLSEDYSPGVKVIDFDNAIISKISITRGVLKNKKAEFIVQTVANVYEQGLVNDLNAESFDMLKNSNLVLRNVSSESNSETWVKSLLKKIYSFTNQYSNLDYLSEEILCKIDAIDAEKQTGHYYSEHVVDIGDTDDVKNVNKINKTPKEIVVSIKLENEDTQFEELRQEGLNDKEIINFTLLHELSHTIQHLHENNESLVATDNSKELLDYGVVSYAADRQLLGSPDYENNNVYSSMLESYADVRGVIMFGILNPNRFNKMLDALIVWRSTVDIKEGHNTTEALRLLKEKYPNGLPEYLQPEDIHKTARNLATLNAVAKQEYLMKSGDSIESALIDNNITYISIKQKGYDKYQHLSKLLEIKEKIIKEENVSEICYKLANFNCETGDKIIRDRNGFIIEDSTIRAEKIKARLETKPNGDTVNKINYLNNQLLLNDYSDNFRMFGKIPPLNMFEEVLDKVKNDGGKIEIPVFSLNGILNDSTCQKIKNYVSSSFNKKDNEYKNDLLSQIALDLNVNLSEISNKISTFQKNETNSEIIDTKPQYLQNNLIANLHKLRKNDLEQSVKNKKLHSI